MEFVMWQLYLGGFLIAGLGVLGFLYKQEVQSHGETKATLNVAVQEIDKLRADFEKM